MTRSTDPYTRHIQLDENGNVIGAEPFIIDHSLTPMERELMKIREATEGILRLLELIAEEKHTNGDV